MIGDGKSKVQDSSMYSLSILSFFGSMARYRQTVPLDRGMYGGAQQVYNDFLTVAPTFRIFSVVSYH